ncbi:hypothetical protein EYZ11_012027 [Aspergillus tanneri]|uniref:BAG domain-containing protein n=1 Tax=Aspergillus tanneri TaxID=1220188 RepID=A0A4S3J3F0_9EURO|nr:uncharacterized protein ATNIH1004_008941 [Aspergillus tanneri]KAA8644734.1 hypothetical protein ATNIH1004_008941 [Aspergillus tanneri]THC88528.1 hypothetical protein EYZ11_012027 [Aspergillus tanneri]
MTPLLSHVSQSSLGETCAFYLDYLAVHAPQSLRSLQRKFVPSLSSPPPHHAFVVADRPTLIFTLLACAIAAAVVIVMSWRSQFTNFWRRSPQYSGVPNPPLVSDGDYSYISPNDIVGPPTRSYGNQYPQDTEPDTLLLKHRRNTYELHFPAYAINDGALSVGQLRQRAAEVTRTLDPKRIRLLYKGNLLDDDSLPCRSEGLKQQSEVLCVVSEVHPGESTPSDASDAEADKPPEDAREGTEKKRTRNRNRNKNKNKRKNKDKRVNDTNGSLAPPSADQLRPSSSGLPASSPNLKAFRTSIEQVQALMSYFHTELVPLCEAYIADPPTELKSRDFEHKKLSETILAQVILKADGIEPDGHEETRNLRRALIKETQSILARLDQAAKE